MIPRSVQQHLSAGIAHHRAGRLREARSCFDRARRAAPHLFEANYLSGAAALQQGKHEIAEPLLAKAGKLNGKSAACAQAHGAALARLGRFEEAEKVVRKALSLQSNLPEGWDTLGYILKARGDLEGAIASHRRAVEVKPGYALGWHHLGLALLHSGKAVESLDCQDRALELSPRLVKAHYGRALALQNCHRLAEAVSAYDRVLSAEPNHLSARSYRLMALNYLPEWSPALLFREHEAFGRVVSDEPDTGYSQAVDLDRPLRVAFLSPDFRTHSVAYFIEPILAYLNAEQFSVMLYHDHFTEDHTTDRLRKRALVWRNFVGLSDHSVAELISEDSPDVLFDLAGHTGMNRLALLGRRLAPVQISYLGYPNTTGLKTMDYRFVDSITDPVGKVDDWHTESLVRLPATAWSYAPPDTAPLPTPTREDAPITFGSFNNPAKISAPLLSAWSRLLAEVPGSRLCLKGRGLDQAALVGPLHEQMVRVGIDLKRVEFLDRTVDLEGHLASYRGIDVALDTYPYHGTTTTCEALWMGVPVVTLLGDRHANRVGASLLHAVGHSEWIAEEWDEYVAIAAQLAHQREKRTGLRTGLRQDMLTSDLMDHAAQADRFGNAIRQCWRIHAESARPASLTM